MPIRFSGTRQGFDIDVRTLGVRGWLPCIPYLTGSRPKFKVSIQRTTSKKELRDCQVRLCKPGDPHDDCGGREPICRLPNLEATQPKIEKDVESPRLAMSGDYLVRLRLEPHPAKGSVYEWLDVGYFNAQAKETVVVGLVSALMAGILCTAIALLLT